MLAAPSSSSFPSDLVAQQLLPTLLAVGVQQELFPAACKSFPMFLNQPAETMDILIIAGMIEVLTQLPAMVTVSHTLPMVKHPNLNQLYQCTMADHLQLEAMEESVPNNLSNHTTLVSLSLNLAALVVQLRPLFLASH